MELSNLSLNELRELARKRQRAVGNKISRLNTQIGVNVGSTKLDPRRDHRKVRKYNRNQLVSYVNSLNSFTDRKTQYVPDAYGRPINRDLWRKYQQKESELNRRVQKNYSRFKNVPIDSSGMTVEERQEMITPRHRQMYNPAVNVSKPQRRKSKAVTSEKALRALIRDMNKKLGSDFIGKELRAGKEQFNKLMSDLSLDSISKRVNKLTPDQFNFLWNYTAFASIASHSYETYQKHVGKFSNAVTDSLSQNESDMNDLLDRAELL